MQARWKDDPEVVSFCSCERLHQHKQVSGVNFTCDKYHIDIWMRLRAHLSEHAFKFLGRKNDVGPFWCVKSKEMRDYGIYAIINLYLHLASFFSKFLNMGM